MADISEFQPDIADATYLNWSKAIAIRALYGDAHDDAAWYGGARRADLHAGGVRVLLIYQYLVAGQSGAAQAQAFHKLVGPIQPGEVFVADFEEGSKSVLTAWYNSMLSLYGSGIKPYLWTYTGLAFGESQGVLPVEWLADYTSKEPSSPHKLWQFTSAYHVPGVGTCDASVFRGTIDQLAALAYQPAEPLPVGTQSGWRHCNRCQALFYAPKPSRCPAPGGGQHTPGSSWNYSLTHVARTAKPGKNTQPGWNWCSRDGVLFFGPHADISVCAAGGRHVTGGSWNYQLSFGVPASGTVQVHWRHCERCQVLFYGPDTVESHCPAGGVHSFGPSWDYGLSYSRSS